MSTPGLPDFPSKRSLNAKIARYHAIADAHRRGEHKAQPLRNCKFCREG